MPDDAPRRRLTIADLRPITRVPEPAQREPPREAPREVPREASRAALRPAPPQAPPGPAKPPQPLPRSAARPVKAPPATPAPPKGAKPPVALPQPATAYVPRTIERDVDGFPCGWAYERYSWGFHRLLWSEHGIRLEFGEYTAIVRQCRNGTGEWLDRNIWRVTLRSGRQIIVAVSHSWQPLTVLPDDWQAHTGWAYGLLANMPEPELVPRLPPQRI